MSGGLAVTTCNGEQWAAYGRRMATTFACHWPPQTELWIYAEDFSPDLADPRVRILDLGAVAPWLKPWQEAHDRPEHHGRGRKPAYDYRCDARRFSFKVAALGAAVERAEVDVLIWLDADTVTHAPVHSSWLRRLFPPDADAALLTRPPHYPETGVMFFRRPRGFAAIRRVVDAYRSDAIFAWPETHDAYVIGRVVDALVAAGELRLRSLSGPASKPSHPLVDAPISACLDHMKGGRKEHGRTPAKERSIRDGVRYWS